MKTGPGFRFVVNKVYTIPGRGTVVTGKVEKGAVSVGDEIGFIGADGQLSRANVSAIEVSRRLVEAAQEGQEASILLEGLRKGQSAQGAVLMEAPEAPPVSVSPTAAETSHYEPVSPSYSSPGPEPIAPSAGVGRFVIYILIGLLILVLLLLLQGKMDLQDWDPRKWDPRKLDPRKKRTSIQPPAVRAELDSFIPFFVSAGEGKGQGDSNL
jgi:hypothetical protein